MQTPEIKRASAIASWLRELTRAPLARNGEFFERLHGSIELSAPVTSTCG